MEYVMIEGKSFLLWNRFVCGDFLFEMDWRCNDFL